MLTGGSPTRQSSASASAGDDLPLSTRVRRITTNGTITEFPTLTPFSEPFGIAAGPDGAMWFTEFNGNNIGRITPSGTVTELPTPTSRSAPFAIAAGPDGAMWFTEFSGNSIGRIPVVPTGKEQCRHGGWRNFAQFKNQDACVRFVEHHHHQHPDQHQDP